MLKEKIKFFLYYLIKLFSKKLPLDSELEILLEKKIPPLHINYNTYYVFNQAKYKQSFK